MHITSHHIMPANDQARQGAQTRRHGSPPHAWPSLTRPPPRVCVRSAGMEEAIFGKKEEASQTAADAELKITVSDE